MRKTNCKETRRAVEAYVLEEVTDILDRCELVNPLRPIDAAFNVLRDEMEYQSDTRDNVSIVGRGIANLYRKSERVHGYVPAVDPYNVWYLAVCAGEFVCYYDDARALVAEWLDETPEEATRYSNSDAWKLYAHLSASAFERLHKKENEPHNIKVSDFITLYNKRNKGHFFDRETLKFFGQTRKSFDIEAFHLIEDHAGVVHDCYKVFSRCNMDGHKFTSVHYFDRVTLDEVHIIVNANEEV